ncbi:MAG: AAA family ATPase [bacterium]
MKNKLIGRNDVLELVNEKLDNLKNKRGGFVLISGDTGSGKSYTLDFLKEKIQESAKQPGDGGCVYVTCRPPIGDFNVSTLQPLHPISLLIKELMEDRTSTPEKKLLVNVGMTLLACIPLGGEIPYAIKEIQRDWKKYREDKYKDVSEARSKAHDEYHKFILDYISKKKIVFIMDDIHWADAESIEFLWTLIEEINKLPLLIIASYNEDNSLNQNLPILSLLKKAESLENIEIFSKIELKPFSKEDVFSMAHEIYFNNYIKNQEFEDWIFEHSMGVPSIISEYLEYFSKYSPFDMDGNLVTNFYNNEFLPLTVQQLFLRKLEDLTEDDKNLLALCSAEGREFSVIIVSQLLNTDVLTTIKKLRAIQNKTNIIQSIGAKMMYGVKTTVYQFTQALYHKYFEKSLEYEEAVALHSQIVTFLKYQYNNSTNEIKELLAPYLAAHATEAGDNETAKEMLMQTAKTAKQFGSSDTIVQAYSNYSSKFAEEDDREMDQDSFIKAMKNMAKDVELKHSGDSGDPENSTQSILVDEFPDYESLRKSLIKNYMNGDLALMIAKIDKYLSINKNINIKDEIQLFNFKAKALIDEKKYDEALKVLEEAIKRAKTEKSLESECLSLNTIAQLNLSLGNTSKALEYLEAAAALSTYVSNELRLMTVANIAVTLKHIAPSKAKKYFDTAMNQCSNFGFEQLANDLKANFTTK